MRPSHAAAPPPPSPARAAPCAAGHAPAVHAPADSPVRAGAPPLPGGPGRRADHGVSAGHHAANRCNGPRRAARLPVALGALALATLAGCGGFDMDFRDLGNGLDTTRAVQTPAAPRPRPDARGIISYPGYQVAVARRGDTVAQLATRIGADAQELARYNGIQTGDPLREGEVIALPTRVAEPEGGPIRSPGDVDIDTLADDAIRRADSQTVETSQLEPTTKLGTE